MIKNILFLILLLNGVLAIGQISHGGTPLMLDEEISSVSLSIQPTLRVSQVYDQKNSKLPLRFATPIFTNLSTSNSGEWNENIDGVNIWRLAIKSEGAKSLNLIFDSFKLREGDKLFVYNKEKTHVLGSFTEVNNNPSGLFAIAPVIGDEIILELQTYAAPDDAHNLLIGAVNHDYIGVADYIKRSIDFGDSGDCNVDVACTNINSNEINRSVCKIIVDGTMLCSGTMLNNVRQDGKPYFLSAAHCFDNSNVTPQNVVFYFNFESPNCDPVIEGTDAQTLSGAQLRSYVENMDLALLEMDKIPPASYRPYWAGWSREEEVSGPVFAVHHPEGDVKKIAISDAAPVATTFDFTKSNGVTFLEDIHWQIENWTSGTTEGGSSGCGLFKDSYLIGSLSGGEAWCDNPVNDYFARFNSLWNKDGADNKQLASWLDSDDSNIIKLDGYDYYEGVTERLTHKDDDGTLLVNYSDILKGSWSGHNSRGYSAYANCFYDVSAANIEGVYIIPQKSAYSDQTVNLKIWDDNEGLPGDILWEKDTTLRGLRRNRENLIDVEPSLSVTGSFFIGFELNYSSDTDTFSVYQVSNINGIEPYNRAYIRDEYGDWVAYNDLHPSGQNGAYYIDVLASDVEIYLDTGNIENKKFDVKIERNPVLDGIIKYSTNITDLSSVDIYSVNGLLVKTEKLHTQSNGGINVSSLVSGIYIVKFSSPNRVVTKRVVIISR